MTLGNKEKGLLRTDGQTEVAKSCATGCTQTAVEREWTIIKQRK